MAQPTGTLRKRLHATAVEAMLDAAERAMTRHGYAKATMQQIAAEAGCAAGTFYLYFRNKRVLFEAIIARHAKAMFALARTETEKSADPLERVRLGLRAILHYGQKYRPLFRLFFTALPLRYRIIREQLGDVSRRESSEYDRLELELLRQAQRQGLARADLPAEVLQSFLDDVAFGFLEQFAFSPGRQPVDGRMRVLWGLIVGGIGGGSSHAKA